MNEQILIKDLNQKLANNHMIEISYHNLYKSISGAIWSANIYFPLYDLDVNELLNDFSEVFEVYPVSLFVESLLYEADHEVEMIIIQESDKSVYSIWKPMQESILSLLKELKIYHPKIDDYLEAAKNYWELETKIMRSENALRKDVIQAHKLKSFDMRITHIILLQMLGKPFNEKVFDLIWPLEVWIELSCEVMESEKDLSNNHFNAYNMFKKIYGEEASYHYKAELENYENLFKERLKQFDSEEQKKFCKSYDFLKDFLAREANYYSTKYIIPQL